MQTPTEDQINDVLDKCFESFDAGKSQYPGMTYEQGVEAAIRWMRGEEETAPLE